MLGFSKAYTGIEISTGILRAVRLSIGAGGRPVVEGYAEKPLPEGVLLPSYAKENILDMKRFKETLQLTLGTAGAIRGDIALSIPDQVVKVSFIELKGVPQKSDEVLKFIKWKSKKSLPYDPEDAKIDYQILRGGDAAMAVFVKGDVVSNYEEALSVLSFRPVVVSTPSLNLFNLFSGRFGELRDFAFISVLEDSFAVIIVKNGDIDFHRSKDIGINDDRLLQEMASSLLYYTSENQDAAIRKIFLYAAADNEGVMANLHEAAGIDVEALKLGGMVDLPGGSNVEPYAAAISAAMRCGI